MEKDTARYTSKRIDIDSLLKKEDAYVSKKLDLDNLLGSRSAVRTAISEAPQEKVVRHLSPGEYIVVISMMLTSLYLMVTSFFPLVYNIATSFEPVNFLTNLFYFILGIGVMAGAFLVLKKGTYLEHIADDTFDEVVYKRLEPVLRDVADVQVGITDVHTQLEMMNLNIEKIGHVKERVTPQEAVPAHTSMYVKYIVLINITLATFLFMLQYPLEYIPYAVTIVYIVWWAVITAEFKLWNVESVWIWVFVPILILPVYTIIMNAYLRDYQMFGSLFIGLVIYVFIYYSWCSNMVRGVLPFDLHIALAELKKKLKEKPEEEPKKPSISMPRIELKMPFKLNLYHPGISMVIGSIVLFASAWFGFSIQNGYIPNVTWDALGLNGFVWNPLFSYALTFIGMILLVAGYSIVLKSRRGGY
ncbi:MAG: hypothetical protein KKD69_05720 [Euryarchaeota archaeon]|nr:hypothetical protein [Euryarchaeota archaeon]